MCNYFLFLFCVLKLFLLENIAEQEEEEKKQEIKNINDIIGNENDIDFSKILSENISKHKSDNSFNSLVKYSADKKSRSNVEENVFFLEGNAKAEVGNTILEAERIKLTAKKDYNLVEGVGKEKKCKDFKYFDPRVKVTFDNKKLYADEVIYCVDSARGIAKNAFYVQDKLIMRAQTVKKDFDNTLYAQNTFLTTCNNSKPHFGFICKKVILNKDKVYISGGNLMLLGVRVPIPFSFIYLIPQERKSGFTYPSGLNWSDSGFYIRDFGYYWYINDCRDLHITGTLYLGSLQFGISARHNYIVKNSYSGSINYTYNASPIYKRMYGGSNVFRNNWSFSWQHKTLHSKQWSFSIDINLRGSGRDDNHNDEDSEEITNSSISFSRQNFLKIFSLRCNANYDKNFKTKVENFVLPSISLSTNSFNFLKIFSTSFSLDFLAKSTNKKISHDVREEHDVEMEAEIQVDDNYSFSLNNVKNIIDNISTGIKFGIPLNIKLDIIKGLNINFNAHYSGRVYNSKYDTDENKIKKSWKKYYYIHDFDIGGSISTTLKSKSLKFDEFARGNIFFIKEFYVTFYPSISFSFVPGADDINFTECYKGDDKKRIDLFAHTVFGNVKDHKSATLSFSLKTSFDIDINNEGVKKSVNLFTATINSGYDFLHYKQNYWKDININFSTKIWKVNVSVDSSFDIYNYANVENDDDAKNERTNVYFWNDIPADQTWYKKLWNEQRMRSSISFSVPLFSAKTTEKKNATIDTKHSGNKIPDYANILLWESLSTSLSYRYEYVYNPVRKIRSIDHICSLNFSSKLSRSWDFNGSVIFNIEKLQFNSFSLGTKCDLHCWTLSTDFKIGRNSENNLTFSYNISFEPRDSVLMTLAQRRSDDYEL